MSGMNRGIGARTLAVLLMSGLATLGGSTSAKAAVESKMAGQRMIESMRFHHRTLNARRNSGAAAQKRASVKRRNVAKRESNRK